MKKIISGILGLLVTMTVVGGTAYAVFVTPPASVQGLSFNTGNAALKVWDGDTYETTYNANWTFSGLYPGYVASPTNFYLLNQSASPISLDIKGNLRSGVTGNWEELKNNVLVAITLSATPPDNSSSDWQTLDYWYATGVNLPGTPLAQNVQNLYYFHVRVPSEATGIENKTLSGVNFDFVGTQTP